MTKATVSQTGIPANQAEAIGGKVVTGLTGAGATQATASICPTDGNVFTTVAAGTGCILGAPSVGSTLDLLNIGDEIYICNYGANALSVYPPTGGNINNGTTNAAISLATNTCARFKKVTATSYGQT